MRGKTQPDFPPPKGSHIYKTTGFYEEKKSYNGEMGTLANRLGTLKQHVCKIDRNNLIYEMKVLRGEKTRKQNAIFLSTKLTFTDKLALDSLEVV